MKPTQIMIAFGIPEMDATAVFTFALFVATVALVVYTRRLVLESREAARRQLGAEMWLRFSERFDSPTMLKYRKDLADVLLEYNPDNGEIVWSNTDGVPDFFEDLGIAYREGYLDKTLCASSFSYFVARWWKAAEAYVRSERVRLNDGSVFEAFEALGAAMAEEGIDREKIVDFLKEEGGTVPGVF